MSDIDGFIHKDPLTSEIGYTLSAALMFGTNATIQQAAPAMEAGLVEMTIPDKPRSSKQKYRLTDKGREIVMKKRTADSADRRG